MARPFRFDGGMLETKLIPAAQSGSRRLMVVLHGLGDSMAGYAWLPAALRLPWLNYLLVNAPDPYYGGYSWFDFTGDPAPGIARSRRLLFELLDTQRTAGYPPEQTLLFGFSQGCLMTVETGVRYPHRLAGLIGISGFVAELEQLIREISPVARQQRFLITHGTGDPLLPFAPAKAQIQRLAAAGLSIEWREFAKEHTIAGEEELAVIRAFVSGGFPTA
jgi:phospholipase/carboxylesterase